MKGISLESSYLTKSKLPALGVLIFVSAVSLALFLDMWPLALVNAETCSSSQAPHSKPSPQEPQKTFAGGTVAPEEYVVATFRNHQIVFLGEMHSVRQNLLFLQGLIPKLYQAGIYDLGFEFSSYVDQPKIDRLITADAYDEHTALELLWHCCDLKWVTQEYADVYRAAWDLNHHLPAGARRFRIIGLDTNPDVPPAGAPVNLMTNGIPDGYTLLRNFGAGNFFWAQVIDKEILQKNEKALVYTGVGHSYTRFFHQRSEDNGSTVGNVIYDAIGSLAFTINLHGSASDGRVELARRVDKLFARLPADQRRMGVDTKSTSLGMLPVTAHGYLYGKGRCSGFTLADVADGYIYLAPIDQWLPVTFRPDFITQDNYDRVEKQWRSDRPRDRRYTIEEMKSMAEAAIRNQYLYQQGRLPGNE